MYYTSADAGNGMFNYFVTLKLFMRCNSGRQFNNPAIISVFNRATNARVQNINVPLGNQQTISLSDAGPCVTNPPQVCYVIGTYEFTLALPASTDGYTLASQVNYRISGISNLSLGYNNVGATYTAEIPGTRSAENGPTNTSAKFIGSDLVVVCANNRFAYSFQAQDSDGDQLRYSFCNAYVSGAANVGNMASAPPSPPYNSVPYGQQYSGFSPLGNNVNIDENTGLITGIAPPTGVYVVTVCVDEIRNGIVIATQRKDLQINIAACDIAAASLKPEYQLCRNSTKLSVVNLSTSNLIKTQDWEIADRAGGKVFTTTGLNLDYTFADTGTYFLKLVINRGQGCSDSAVSPVKVYPGFIPAFDYNGVCFTKPSQFTDQTTTRYGNINAWKWDFGDIGLEDTSTLRNPSYTYGSKGTKVAILTVSNSVGCTDTAMRNLPIFDKPPLQLAFTDTLICRNDVVQLRANGNGLFTWSPNTAMVNANTAAATVTPLVTTRFYVDLDDQGCLNRDSVLVRVVNQVTLKAMNDTLICEGDQIQLRVQSDAFHYTWTPAAQIDNPNVANPFVTTPQVTSYEVTAVLGGCTAKDQVRVITVPYPVANAGADTMICFNSSAQLHGTTDGTSFRWTPTVFLDNTNTLDPITKPPQSISYILLAFDTRGCPKPGRDTMQVIVLPDIKASAGNDTSIVVGQDLQMNASGGLKYAWQPTNGLSNAGIPNPVARFNEPIDIMRYSVYVYNQAGCVDTASINIKVFSTLPSVFVPSAFTPNNDGRNDVLRPIAAGIKQMEYFNIYNRWGKLVFSTSEDRKGWDGNVNGMPQAPGTFVWAVKAVDYTGKPYMQKGTLVLIR